MCEMNPLLDNDLFILICNNFYYMKNIIQLELLSKYHYNIVRNNIWYKQIKIYSDSNMEHVIKHYKFKNITVSKKNQCQ